MNGLYFPAPGEFYTLLPYILRSQDSGFLLAFTELIRVAHNWANEDARVLTGITNPLNAGQFSPENYNESPDELAEFLARVEAGDARLDSPPTSLRFSADSIAGLRRLIGLTADNVASTVPLEELVDSVAKRVVQTARARHRTRGSKWLANNIGRMLGIGDLRVIEMWSRATLSNPTDLNDASNDDDLSESPEKYPLMPGGLQSPPGSPEWNQWDYSDSGEYETQEYPGLSADPFAPNYFEGAVNGHNPWVSMSGGNWEAKPLAVGSYSLRSAKFAFVEIPYADGSGSVRVSSLLPGEQGARVSVGVGMMDGGVFQITLSGPKSSIKYKSSVYDLVLYVDLLTSVSMLEFDDDVLDLASLARPLELLLHEEFIPLTRALRNAVVGVAMRDQVAYAPYHPLRVLCLPDGAGTVWKVNPIPTAGVGNLNLSGDDGDRPYSLTEPTPGEIAEAEAEGEVIQWDHVLGGHYRYGLSGTGAGSEITLSPLPDAPPFALPSRVIYLNPWFVWVEDGRLEVRGVVPDGYTGYMLTGGPDDATIGQYLDTLTEDIRPEALQHMTVEAEPPDVEPEIAVSDRPQDVLRISGGTIMDNASFSVEQRWGGSPGQGSGASQTWWSQFGGEGGADIRMRAAGIHGATIQHPELALATRDQGLSFLNRHGRYVWRAAVDPDDPGNENYPLVSTRTGDGAMVHIGVTDPDGPQEGSPDVEPDDGLVPSQGLLVEPNDKVFWSFAQTSGVFKVMPRNDVTGAVSDDGGMVALTLTGNLPASIPASVAIPSGPLAGVHDVNFSLSTTGRLVLDSAYEASDPVQVLPRMGAVSSLESSGNHVVKLTLGGTANVSYVLAATAPDGTRSVVASESSAPSRQLLFTHPITQGHELALYLGCTDSFTVLVTTDLSLEAGDLPGTATWSSCRDAVQVLKYVRKVTSVVVGTDGSGNLMIPGRHDGASALLGYAAGASPVAITAVSFVSYDAAANVSLLETPDAPSLDADGTVGTLTVDGALSGTPALYPAVAVESQELMHFTLGSAPPEGSMINVGGVIVEVGASVAGIWPQAGPDVDTDAASITVRTGGPLTETVADGLLGVDVPEFTEARSGSVTVMSTAHGLGAGDAVLVSGRWMPVASVPGADLFVIPLDSGFETGIAVPMGDVDYVDGSTIGVLTFERTLAE